MAETKPQNKLYGLVPLWKSMALFIAPKWRLENEMFLCLLRIEKCTKNITQLTKNPGMKIPSNYQCWHQLSPQGISSIKTILEQWQPNYFHFKKTDIFHSRSNKKYDLTVKCRRLFLSLQCNTYAQCALCQFFWKRLHENDNCYAVWHNWLID